SPYSAPGVVLLATNPCGRAKPRLLVFLPCARSLAERPVDVIHGVLVLGIVEDLLGRSEFHEVARPAAFRRIDVQKPGVIGDARGLLEMWLHGHDREPLFQLRY